MQAILKSLLAVTLLAALSTSSAQFTGDLRLTPKGCEATGQCTLKEAIRFTDSSGLVWEAKAGLVTDGASIPGVFQPLIGEPFYERFIRAAVVHDHYCDRHVRSWRRTHRVFYEALVDQGVSIARAKTMYYAVLVGGPKWVRLIPGVNCGQNCVNNLKSTTGVGGFRSRSADYSDPNLSTELKQLLVEFEANPTALTLDELDGRAKARKPNDFYFSNGDSVVVTNPLVTE